jgi:hypothetical protein
MTQPLHKLPNGAWIDLASVQLVFPRAAASVASISLPCAVCVVAGLQHIELPFETFGAATAYADSLAALVNAARSGDAIARAAGS